MQSKLYLVYGTMCELNQCLPHMYEQEAWNRRDDRQL